MYFTLLNIFHSHSGRGNIILCMITKFYKIKCLIFTTSKSHSITLRTNIINMLRHQMWVKYKNYIKYGSQPNIRQCTILQVKINNITFKGIHIPHSKSIILQFEKSIMLSECLGLWSFFQDSKFFFYQFA